MFEALGTLLLLGGLLGFVIFRKTTHTVAIASEQATQVWAEEVIMNAQLRRQENFAEFQKALTGEDGEKIEVISHEDVMKALKIND